MEYVIAAVIGVICLVLGVLAGYVFGDKTGFKKGYQNRLEIGEKAIGSAEEEAKRIIAEATKKGEARCKELLVEAKEDILKAKTEAERENKDQVCSFTLMIQQNKDGVSLVAQLVKNPIEPSAILETWI